MASSKTMQAVVEIAGTLSPTLEKAAKGAQKSLEGINLKAIAVGAGVAAAGVAIGKATIAAGKYLVNLGGEFDSVIDTIRIGTGATGEALEALTDDFNELYKSVPTTMEDASKAIADYNTQLGLTGPELQGISKQALQVSDMLGDDLDGVIKSSSKALQAWNIDADDMGDAMDYVFKASQSTGMGFTELMSNVQQFAPQLQEMGYSFEDSATLIGQLEKAGVNTSEVLSAMKKGVGTLAKEGLSASKGLELYADRIKNAGDMAEATTIASEIFGIKAGSTMAAAIRQGTLSVAELSAELANSSETIGGAAEDTYDFAERLQLFKQKAQVALQPLAGTMFDALNDMMPVVGSLMDGLIPIIEEISATLVPLIQDVVAKIAPMLQELVPPLLKLSGSLAQKLIPPIVNIITSILPVLINLVEMLMPVIDVIISDILPVVIDLLNELTPVIMDIIGKILPVVTGLLKKIVPILSKLLCSILPVIIELIEALVPVVMEIIDAVLPVIIQLLDILVPILTTIIEAVLPVITSLINALLPIIMQIIEAVLPPLISLLNVLTPIFDLIISLLNPILQLFTAIIEPIVTLIGTALEPLISVFTSLITSVLEPIAPLIEFVADLFTTVLGGAIAGIQPIIEGLMDIFGGVIDFISGVFSGNWEQAWDGIVGIFKGIFNLIPTIVESIINGAIGIINGIISGINTVTGLIGIPEIPLIPTVSLPRFAEGGFTEGISIAGEAGTEAIISFDPSVRAANIQYWETAGEMLGVYNESDTALAGDLLNMDDFSLTELSQPSTTILYDFSGFTWSPVIEGNKPGEDNEDLMRRLKAHEAEFFDWLDHWIQSREVTAFA